ncbi:Uncharacterised protein [Klebsiella pneumoniae]|nr:Uncharacterised protein [Klebsiella pneumoniae]
MAQHLAADIHCHLIAGVNQLRFCAASLAACLANRIGNQRLILRQLRGLQHQRGVGGRILGCKLFNRFNIAGISNNRGVFFQFV